MEQETKNGRRLIKITQGNVDNGHIYITGHQDFFPKDCVGGANARTRVGTPLVLELDGLSKEVSTDIPIDARTGKPRRHFRSRDPGPRSFLGGRTAGPKELFKTS
jgi:hypothetical protein